MATKKPIVLGLNGLQELSSGDLLSGRFVTGFWPNVLEIDVNDEPDSPDIGDTYITGSEPWTGYTNQVVVWNGASWDQYVPDPGWLAWLVE